MAGLLSTGTVLSSPSAAADSGSSTPLVPSQSLGAVPAQEVEEAGKALPEPSWPDAAQATVDLSQAQPGEPGTVTPEPSASATPSQDVATEVADVVEVAPLPEGDQATTQFAKSRLAAEDTPSAAAEPSAAESADVTAAPASGNASTDPSSQPSPSASDGAGEPAGDAVSPEQVDVRVLDRQEVAPAGGVGLGVQVTRTDGVSAAGQVQIAIDYSGFKYAYGGDFASRLRLVKVPDCALQTPDAEGCTEREFVPVDNDTATGTLTATVTAEPDSDGLSTQLGTASGSTFLLNTGSSSDKGDYRASTLSPTGSWEVATGSGAFTYNLPVSLPKPAMGEAPSLAMTYNSQSVDGRTSATNNQASWVGMGWDLSVGFIERQYRNCSQDGLPTIGDLCWDSPNTTDEPDGAVYVINLNGVSSTLVQDNTGTGSYHLRDDPGWRVQHLDGGHGADDEYWVISTPDGKHYYFGWGRSERTGAATSSVFTVPVVGNDAGEPCHDKFPEPCTQAWRWSLDRTVDANEVESAYFYDKESNYYRSVANTDKARSYTAGGYLSAIEYGWPAQITGAKPTGRVELTHVGRCVERMSDADPLRTEPGACPSIASKPTSYPDVPVDLMCDGTSADYYCAGKTYYPTFFSKDMLWDIKTFVLNTDMSGWDLVQQYQTKHGLPNPDGSIGKTLWLDYVQRKTYGSGTDIVLPVINFNGVDLDNKVGSTELNFRRVNEIHGDLGATTTVDYGSPNPCSIDALPSEASNAKDCFRQKWTAEGETEAKTGWFKKFLVMSVTVDPTVTDSQDGAPKMTTSYDYQGGAGWRFGNDPLTKDADESWTDWRGYQKVEVTSGTGAVKHSTFHWLYRGLDGDRTSKTDASATRSVKVYDGEGTAYTDSPWLQGKTIETSKRDDTGSSQERVFHHYWDHVTSTYKGLPDARFVREDETTTLSKISTGWRTHVVENEYDAAEPASGTYGLALRTDDQGEAGVSDNQCTTYGRAYNTDYYDGSKIQRWMILTDETRHYAAGCTDRAAANQDAYTVSLYDNAADVASNKPVDGNATETRKYASAGTTDFIKARSDYDDAGRVTWTEDADRNRTTTTYNPANTWPTNGVTTTTPKPSSDPTDLRPALSSTVWTSRFWGVVYQTKDPNGKITKLTLDAAGRPTEVWKPTETGTSPSLKFSYSIPTATSNGIPDSVNGFPKVATHTLQSGTKYLSAYAYTDGLGRARETQTPLPDGNMGTANRQVAVTRYDTAGNVTGTSAVFANVGTAGSGGPASPKVEDLPSYTDLTLDWAGRTTVSQILVGNGSSTTSTLHGRVVTRYFGDYTTVTPAVADPTDTYTDVFGQTSKVVEHNGTSTFTTQYGYDAKGNLETITDPRGNITGYTYDWAGQRVTTRDPDAGKSDTTYDNNGRVDTVTSNYDYPIKGLSTVLTYDYDNLGRKTSVATGTTKLASWQWDGIGVTGGKGHITSTTSRDTEGRTYTTKTGSFDDRGRPLSTTVTIPTEVTGLAGDYTTRYGYDAADHLTSVTYPPAGGLAEETVTAGYDDYGRPRTLISPLQTYVRATDYDAYGRLTSRSYGPDLTSSTAAKAQRTYGYYDDNGTRRLQSIITTTASGPAVTPTTLERQQDTYTYDFDGRLTQLREQATGQTAQSQCFLYDGQGRLTGAHTRSTGSACALGVSDFTGPDPYETDYTYDRLGNLQSVTDTNQAGTATTRDYLYPGYDDAGTWTTANAARLHGVRKINTISAGTTTGTETLTYDHAGQMDTRIAADKSTDYDWTKLGQLATVKTTTIDGSKLTRYAYDADGNLLLRTTPQEKVLSLGGMEVRIADDTVTATRYYTSGGATAAMRTTEGTTANGGKVTYLMADTQASTQLAVDATTGTTTRRRYTPFGDERGGTLPTGTDKGFLGKTEDTSTGLSLLGARAYDPLLGRFLSPDPLNTPYDPQNLSAYSYSANDPINYSDPTGLLTEPIGISGGEDPYDDSKNSESWEDSVTPSSEDSTGLGTQWALASPSQTSNMTGGYWLPETNAFGTPEVLCFGRRACSRARNYIYEHPEDVAGAKEIAATYCLNHYSECAKDARIWERTNEIGYSEFTMLFTFGYGPLLSAESGLKAAVKFASCTKCFLAGTDVLMADGTTKDIEDVQPGDKVQATDPETGKSGPREVTRLIITKGDKHFSELSIATGDGIEKLTATYEHPFWSPSEGDWIEAGNFQPGMTLLTDSGGDVIVTANRAYAERAKTYNLTVDDLHTYYVLAGETPVLVHNSNCEPRFSVDSKGKVTDLANPGGRVGVPKLEGGTLQEVGGRIWGSGDPSHLIGTRSQAELRGLASRGDAEKLQDFYQSAALAGKGGKTAPARVVLTQEIIDAWR
ncbi:RHS repeat-associated protein [Streptomyces sp. TLI_55]|uniref:polymorphic toxin-type HINT domain-containing protein n=1 Tax=Streptomyces sp. TLI_55 TaxID=1938861 RepID=UPI000BC39B15|nr:polymorphic toxin-type HINT domain-containing protein [Streptomyces sp. TLI_55]SNX88767.1 RHS repeat-associated protein [Streptomyces sp. TLI_55]